MLIKSYSSKFMIHKVMIVQNMQSVILSYCLYNCMLAKTIHEDNFRDQITLGTWPFAIPRDPIYTLESAEHYFASSLCGYVACSSHAAGRITQK